MSITKKYDEWLAGLERLEAEVGGVKVAMWRSGGKGLPVTLYVHGVTGDHYGLVPLAYERREQERAVLFDLPGHGESSLAPWFDRPSFQDWLAQFVEEIEEEIELVIGHSFGCSVALGATGKAPQIILVNPPGKPTRLSRFYAGLMRRGGEPVRWLYNRRMVALLRGFVMSRRKFSPEAWERIKWESARTPITRDMFRYFLQISNRLMDGKLAARGVRGSDLAVIGGLRDNLVKVSTSRELARELGGVEPLLVDGGHLLPIEAPEVVNGLIGELHAPRRVV